MPTDAEPCLVDTSAAVALVVTDHEHHAATLDALGRRELGLCGHAAFETYSVLTRLPGTQRLSPAVAQRVLSVNFPHTRYLGRDTTSTLLATFSDLALAGGSVYDALVAAAAVEYDQVLVSRDRRAADTYRRLGVRLQLLT